MSRAIEIVEAALDALRVQGDAEVFVRWTRRLRLEMEEDRTRVAHGVEEGTAVRLRARDGAVRFGASSGTGPDAIASASATACALPTGSLPDPGAAWGTGGPWMDLGGPQELPAVDEAEAWLRRAWRGGRAHLDVAVSIEALGSLDGLRACRSRGAVWARRLERSTVRSAVADRLAALDPADWDEPPATEGGVGAAVPVPEPIALLPGAAGALAPALVAAVHVAPFGGIAGPGWVCADEGGAFDDTGFPSGRLELAAGGRLLAAARGPGRRRRLSFRTPPVDRPAHLRFQPTGAWGGSGLLARSARPHPGEGGVWWTVLEAAPAGQGRLLGPWGHWVVRAEPGAWVAGCCAGVGSPRRTPEGVTTPTLVFDGLTAVALA